MTSPLRRALTSTPATFLFALGVWLSALGACTWAARQLAPARAPAATVGLAAPAATACRPPDVSADTTLRAEARLSQGPAASGAFLARIAPGGR